MLSLSLSLSKGSDLREREGTPPGPTKPSADTVIEGIIIKLNQHIYCEHFRLILERKEDKSHF